MLCDECDNAGVWEIDEDAFEYFVGESVSLEEIICAFGDRVMVHQDKLVLTKFVEFQYGVLNNSNNAHRSVIQRLTKLGLKEALMSPSRGALDTDTVKDMEMDKDLVKEKEKEKETTDRRAVTTTKSKFDFEDIYAGYPRKEDKATGMDVLKKTILTEVQCEELRVAVKNYADECRLTNREKRYIRQWGSFIGPASKPFWRDWIDWKADTTKRKVETAQTKLYNNLDQLEEELSGGQE